MLLEEPEHSIAIEVRVSPEAFGCLLESREMVAVALKEIRDLF